MDNLIKLIPLISTYPMWVKLIFILWVILTLIFVISLALAPRSANKGEDKSNPIEASTGLASNQAISVQGNGNIIQQFNNRSGDSPFSGTTNTAIAIDKASVEQLIVNNYHGSKASDSGLPTAKKYQELQLKLPKSGYELTITGSSRTDTRIISPDESIDFRMDLHGVDRYIKNIKVLNRATGESSLFDFTSGQLPKGIRLRRTADAYYPDRSKCSTRSVKNDEPRFVSIGGGDYALYIEPASTNYLLHSGDPKKQFLRLYPGVYTFWFHGKGTVVILNVDKKIGHEVFPSAPYTFEVSADDALDTTIYGVIPKDNIDCFQLEENDQATSYMPTENSTVSRDAEVVSYDTDIFIK